jgi:hypothetical protein
VNSRTTWVEESTFLESGCTFPVVWIDASAATLSADSETRLFCWVIDAAAATSADSVTLLLGWTDISWSTYETIQRFIYRNQGKKVIHANSLTSTCGTCACPFVACSIDRNSLSCCRYACLLFSLSSSYHACFLLSVSLSSSHANIFSCSCPNASMSSTCT